MMVGKVGETPVMKRPSTRQPSKPRRVMRKPSASGDMGQDGTPKRKEAAPSLPIPEIPKEAKKGSTKRPRRVVALSVGKSCHLWITRMGGKLWNTRLQRVECTRNILLPMGSITSLKVRRHNMDLKPPDRQSEEKESGGY